VDPYNRKHVNMLEAGQRSVRFIKYDFSHYSNETDVLGEQKP